MYTELVQYSGNVLRSPAMNLSFNYMYNSLFLAAMIGSWHHTVVCLSVLLSLTLCIVALGIVIEGWQLYHHVAWMVLPIHFFRHFYCRIRCSSPTHSEKPNRQNFRIWNSHGWHDHVTVAFPDATISAVWFCSYTIICSTIGVLSNSYGRFLFKCPNFL